MTPATIIKDAMADGVELTPSVAGTLKVRGEQEAVNRWLPIIRERKAGVIKALLESSACTGELNAIRAWLTYIGENDPEIINAVLDGCRTDPEARAYYLRRSAEI